jgi:hypothetical protein
MGTPEKYRTLVQDNSRSLYYPVICDECLDSCRSSFISVRTLRKNQKQMVHQNNHRNQGMLFQAAPGGRDTKKIRKKVLCTNLCFKNY